MPLESLIKFREPSAGGSLTLPDLLAREALTQIAPKAVAAIEEDAGGQIAGHLAGRLLADTPDGGLQYTELLLANGVPADRLLRTYIPGAADILGKYWVDDRLSFADVTHALGNLMTVARRAIPVPVDGHVIADQPRILLSRTPREEHVLGLLLLAIDMRRQGWLVRIDLSGDAEVFSALLGTHHFDAVGLTAACPARLGDLAAAIALVRRAQPHAKTMVGGGVADRETHAIADLGADLALGRHSEPVAQVANLLDRTK
ncbi:MAG: cobalamin B12-binding domain-containing protein [Pseudomonadota bacterium]